MDESASDAHELSQSLWLKALVSSKSFFCKFRVDSSHSLIEDSQIFVGLAVPLVMFNRIVQTNGPESDLLVGRHDAPDYATIGQVVRGRKSLGKQEWLLK